MKTYQIIGTPFYLWWGGREVQGQCKWVVDSNDLAILDDFTLDWDQFYCDKYEAMDRCVEWWQDNEQNYA